MSDRIEWPAIGMRGVYHGYEFQVVDRTGFERMHFVVRYKGGITSIFSEEGLREYTKRLMKCEYLAPLRSRCDGSAAWVSPCGYVYCADHGGPDVNTADVPIENARRDEIRAKLAAIEAKRARPLGWDPYGDE